MGYYMSSSKTIAGKKVYTELSVYIRDDKRDFEPYGEYRYTQYILSRPKHTIKFITQIANMYNSEDSAQRKYAESIIKNVGKTV